MKILEGFNCKIFTDNIEQSAIDQIQNLLVIPAFKNSKIRIMPDVHAGAGCVIGFTADLGDKVIPNIVGVDIGCGMKVMELTRKPNLQLLDFVINTTIPCGRNNHTKDYFSKVNHVGILNAYITCKDSIKQLRCYRYLHDQENFRRAIGSLGGGNHFIELDKSESGKYYLVIHTGSRNLGKQVADYYQKLAIQLHSGFDKLFQKQQELIDKYKSEGRKSEIQEALKQLRKEFKQSTPLIPNELCWLEGNYRDDYLHDMRICQEYAYANRYVISRIILDKLGLEIFEEFDTIHNYLSFEDNIIRKGAISCREGEKVIIPMNMRDGSLICIGKGNSDWNNSGPHGAGRIMSRAQAFKDLSIEDFRNSMKGIYTTTAVEETLDEAPMAYKPMNEIIGNIKDTVDIIEIIKPIYNFKAAE